MNNSIQRIAELEAQVASLSAERDALKREGSRINVDELSNKIGAHLTRVERNLREDFVGKFAGNFLLATETITNRVVVLEERESRLEERYKELESRIKNHIKTIIDTVYKQSAKQKEIGQAFCKATDVLLDANEKYVAINREAAQSCLKSAKTVSDAAQMCASFKADYEAVANKASGNIKRLADESERSMSRYLWDIKQSARQAIEPLFHSAEEFTKASRKRTVIHIVLGLILGLFFSTCFAWLTQPQSYLQLDAQKWRTFISDLTPTQREKVKNLLLEIETEKKEAEKNSPK